MRVAVTLEARFQRTHDGCVWTTGSFNQTFWSRYLDVFQDVTVIARVADVGRVADGAQRADGARITFKRLPNYRGVNQFVRSYFVLRKAIHRAVGPDDAVIMRVPSALAILLRVDLRRQGRPYAVEVVGDPAYALTYEGVRHPLAPAIRSIFIRQLQRQCSEAVAAAYVTKRVLQERYPVGAKFHKAGSAARSRLPTHNGLLRRSYFYSDVALGNGFSEPRPRSTRTLPVRTYSYANAALAAAVRGPVNVTESSQEIVLVTVGSLDNYHKGVDMLIAAVAKCHRHGLNLHLNVVGDGRHRPALEQLARREGISQQVTFLGHLRAGEPVRNLLDRADLFVLASRTEGLPRAMLEAMARGLPCIGTAVGGIPELLDQEDLVPAADLDRLASLIEVVVSNPTRMEAMAKRCFATAQEYREDILRERRNEFFLFVRQETEEWLAGRALTVV